MEVEKRKRTSDGETAAGRKGKAPEDEGGAAVKVAVPADEEVEEFFAILRRIKVALKYFQNRNGGRELTAPAPWSPSFEREDFDGVKKTTENPEGNQFAGLDLNSDPVSDERDASDSV